MGCCPLSNRYGVFDISTILCTSTSIVFVSNVDLLIHPYLHMYEYSSGTCCGTLYSSIRGTKMNTEHIAHATVTNSTTLNAVDYNCSSTAAVSVVKTVVLCQ